MKYQHKFLTSVLAISLLSGCGSDSNNESKGQKQENGDGKNYNKNSGNAQGKGNSNSKNHNEYASIDENGNIILNKDVLANISISDLNQSETKALQFVREEEKLARVVYLELDRIYKSQTNIFGNIAKAEQTHTDSVKVLLERYNLDDPMSDDTNVDIGIFQNSKLQTIYNRLIEKGQNSLADAFEVGLTIEDLDIHDIEEYMKTTDNEDILYIFKKLVEGSENHLRAFYKNSDANYIPQYISESRYYEILASEVLESDSESNSHQKDTEFPPSIPNDN